jgi:hypothetical protein
MEILESYWKNIFGSVLLINIFNYLTAILSSLLKERGNIGIFYRLYRNLLSLTGSSHSDLIFCYFLDFLRSMLDFFDIQPTRGPLPIPKIEERIVDRTRYTTGILSTLHRVLTLLLSENNGSTTVGILETLRKTIENEIQRRD